MFEQRFGLTLVEIRRERARQTRRFHGACGVHVDTLITMHPAVEAAHGREVARDGAFGESPARAVRHEAADVRAPECVPLPTIGAVRTGEPRGELTQVASIRRERVDREVALFLEMHEKLVDLGGEYRFRERAVATHECITHGSRRE